MAAKHTPAARTSKFQASITTDGALELLIYGEIVDGETMSMLEAWGLSTDGFVSSNGVKKALDNSGDYDKIRLRINSPGGDAFEGIAIHSLLTGQAKPVEAYIDGIAASSASIIAMGASKRIMGRSAMMMIHNAWAACVGNKAAMTKMAGTLDQIDASIAAAYADRTGQELDALKALMDEEMWMTAQECLDKGFATGIVDPPKQQSASAMAQARRFKMLAKLKNVPEQFRANVDQEECQCDCEACASADCSNCSNRECEDANCKDCPMQASAANKAKPVRAASQCSCKCEACASDSCQTCANQDCRDAYCKDCPMQMSRSNQADTSFERAKLRLMQRCKAS